MKGVEVLVIEHPTIFALKFKNTFRLSSPIQNMFIRDEYVVEICEKMFGFLGKGCIFDCVDFTAGAQLYEFADIVRMLSCENDDYFDDDILKDRQYFDENHEWFYDYYKDVLYFQKNEHLVLAKLML